MWWSETSVFSPLLTQNVWLCNPLIQGKATQVCPYTSPSEKEAGHSELVEMPWGVLESSVRQLDPGLPPVSKFTSTPAFLNFGVPVPSSLPVLPDSTCVLLRQLLYQTAFPQHFLSPSPGFKTGHWSWGPQSPEVKQIDRLQVPTAWVPGLVLQLTRWENPAKLLIVPQALVSSSLKWE